MPSIVKLFEKCAFTKGDIITALNQLYNKNYEKYAIPEGEQLIIHSQKDINKVVAHLYDNFNATMSIKASDTCPEYGIKFADRVLLMRTHRLVTIIASYYRLFDLGNPSKHAKITETIISFIPWEDPNKFIEAIIPQKKNKKNYKMVVDDGNAHFFMELELKYLCPIHLNRKINPNVAIDVWRQNCRDSNVIGGKSDVLQLNVLKNVHIDSTYESVAGSIFNKKDVVLNIDGNLEIASGARIRSKEGNIVLNVGGNIHLRKGAKIVTNNANIYIRCDNMIMADHSFIETYDFGEKYKKINHITLNYQLTKANKRKMYGDVYMNVKNNLTVGNGACRIKSGDIRIECGGTVDFRRLRCIFAFRNNVEINCEEMRVPMSVLEKKIDARNQTLIKSKKPLSIKGFVNSKYGHL